MFDAFAATTSGTSLRSYGDEILWMAALHGIAAS
jgi:hypothetical protein